MSGQSDARDLIDAVQSLGGPVEIDPEKHYAVPLAGEASVHLIAPADESLLASPRRTRGTVTVYDVDSLKAVWDKHSEFFSDLYGDPVGHSFTAVFDADAGSDAGVDIEVAGFREHRAHLPLRVTPAWKAWTAINGTMLSQVDFAEFLEARMVDVVRPTGADMLELATTLESSSSVEFKSAVSLSSGVRQFAFEETQTARAGQTGQLEIPKDIELGIAPFEDGEPFRVTARFRHRIRNGTLTLGVVLDRPEDVVKAAFDAFAEQVGAACDQTVIAGVAPGPTLQSPPGRVIR